MGTEKKKIVRIDNVAFVKAWQTSHSIEDAIERIGACSSAVRTHARKLRAAGVELRDLKSRSKQIDVVGLNALIKDLA